MILVEAECSLVWLHSRERGVAKDADREREGKGERERSGKEVEDREEGQGRKRSNLQELL